MCSFLHILCDPAQHLHLPTFASWTSTDSLRYTERTLDTYLIHSSKRFRRTIRSPSLHRWFAAYPLSIVQSQYCTLLSRENDASIASIKSLPARAIKERRAGSCDLWQKTHRTALSRLSRLREREPTVALGIGICDSGHGSGPIMSSSSAFVIIARIHGQAKSCMRLPVKQDAHGMRLS